MNYINKWEQALIFREHPTLCRHYPSTERLTDNRINEFLNHYPFVYVKPVGGREGRGVIRIEKNMNGSYTVNGYTYKKEKINKEFSNLEEVIAFLHYSNVKKSLPSCIIQQGISSLTPNGQALGVRVHIQSIGDKWVLGGMLGKLGSQDDGIVNRNCGAKALLVRKLFVEHLQMNEAKAQALENNIQEICLEAGKVFREQYDWIVECGINIGIDRNGDVWIFEVNMRPSIKFFYELEDQTVVHQILENRKLRLKTK
ncbi:YheC/YheD family protein [Bacillus sp. FJAT-49736]|uniref:YheC/YheD family protein n=1 Tax=Bacillus sp. FJAT-49736 TaxID=2833582 RepID=UPI001BC9BCE7|nr:YheC/YheD family protein [Bacillus sp. FJAT-49736]